MTPEVITILVVAGIYVIAALIMKTKNFLSSVIFKVIPAVSAVALMWAVRVPFIAWLTS